MMGEREEEWLALSFFFFFSTCQPRRFVTLRLPTSTTDTGFEIDKNLRHGTLNNGRTKKKDLFMGLVGLEKSVWLMQGDRAIILFIIACI